MFRKLPEILSFWSCLWPWSISEMSLWMCHLGGRDLGLCSGALVPKGRRIEHCSMCKNVSISVGSSLRKVSRLTGLATPLSESSNFLSFEKDYILKFTIDQTVFHLYWYLKTLFVFILVYGEKINDWIQVGGCSYLFIKLQVLIASYYTLASDTCTMFKLALSHFSRELAFPSKCIF